jgi:hypothetical protein
MSDTVYREYVISTDQAGGGRKWEPLVYDLKQDSDITLPRHPPFNTRAEAIEWAKEMIDTF